MCKNIVSVHKETIVQYDSNLYNSIFVTNHCSDDYKLWLEELFKNI